MWGVVPVPLSWVTAPPRFLLPGIIFLWVSLWLILSRPLLSLDLCLSSPPMVSHCSQVPGRGNKEAGRVGASHGGRTPFSFVAPAPAQLFCSSLTPTKALVEGKGQGEGKRFPFLSMHLPLSHSSQPEFVNVCFWFVPPSLRGKQDSPDYHERLSKVGVLCSSAFPLGT